MQYELGRGGAEVGGGVAVGWGGLAEEDLGFGVALGRD